MPLVRSRSGDHGDLSARSFAIFGAIGVAEDVVFPHGVHAKQLVAHPIRRIRSTLRVGADVVHSVDRPAIGFLPLARYRERGPASRSVRPVIIDGRVEHQKVVEAAAIQRHVLDLLLVDQSGDRTERRIHDRRLFRHRYFLDEVSHIQRQIHDRFLRHNQRDAASHLLPEAWFFCCHFIGTYRKGRHRVAAFLVGLSRARQPGLGVFSRNSRSRDHGSSTVAREA